MLLMQALIVPVVLGRDQMAEPQSFDVKGFGSQYPNQQPVVPLPPSNNLFQMLSGPPTQNISNPNQPTLNASVTASPPPVDYSAKAMQTNVETEPQYFERGVARYMLQDYTGALADFNEVIIRNPKNGEAYLYRGRCKKELKDTKSAIADFEKALKLNPESPNYYLQKGFSKGQSKDFTGALESFDKAIELKPSLPEAYLGRGDSKAQMGNYSAAIADYDAAIGLDKNNADAFLKRAYAKFKLKDFSSSMSDQEKAKDLYQAQQNAAGYQNSIRAINLLREIMTGAK